MITYNLATRNGRLNAVVTLIDAGAGAGSIQLLAGSSTVLSTLPLVKPSATVAGGVLTFLGLPLTNPAAAATGIADNAQILDGNSNVVASGLTVGFPGTGADIALNNTLITAGQAISITSATITEN